MHNLLRWQMGSSKSSGKSSQVKSRYHIRSFSAVMIDIGGRVSHFAQLLPVSTRYRNSCLWSATWRETLRRDAGDVEASDGAGRGSIRATRKLGSLPGAKTVS